MNKKRLTPNFFIKVGLTEVKPTKNVKYLGVTLDNGYNFFEDVTNINNKAIKIMATLARIMANTINIKRKNKTLY